jgi:hypothetical protein
MRLAQKQCHPAQEQRPTPRWILAQVGQYRNVSGRRRIMEQKC